MRLDLNFLQWYEEISLVLMSEPLQEMDFPEITAHFELREIDFPKRICIYLQNKASKKALYSIELR